MRRSSDYWYEVCELIGTIKEPGPYYSRLALATFRGLLASQVLTQLEQLWASRRAEVQAYETPLLAEHKRCYEAWEQAQDAAVIERVP